MSLFHAITVVNLSNFNVEVDEPSNTVASQHFDPLYSNCLVFYFTSVAHGYGHISNLVTAGNDHPP